MGTTQRSAPPVVVAVDGSGQGLGAVRFALDEARARATGVRMVHVLERDDTGQIMDPYMTEACVAAPDVELTGVSGAARSRTSWSQPLGPATSWSWGRRRRGAPSGPASAL